MGKYSEALRKRLRRDPWSGAPQQENRETEPRVQIDFWFSRHKNAHDVEQMRERFQQADVFIPEMLGYKPEHLAKFQAVADGTLSPEEALRPDEASLRHDEYTAAKLKLLAGSNKLILAIDKPFYDGFDLENYQEEYFENYAIGELLSGQLQRSVNMVINGFAKYVKSQHQREQLMLQRLKQQLGNAQFQQWCKSRSQQTGSNDIRVLIQLGASHTKVGLDAAKTLTQPVERHFPERPYLFAPFDTEYRRFIFGKKRTFDEPMAERILTQHLTHFTLLGYFGSENIERIDPNGIQEHRLANVVAKAITREDLEQFATACQSIEPPLIPKEFAKTKIYTVGQARQFIGTFCELLSQRGIQFPTTESDWVRLTTA